MNRPTTERVTEARRLGEGDLTHNAVRELLQSELRSRHPGDGVWVWIRDVSDTWVVYEVEAPDAYDVFQATYTIGDDNTVTLGPDTKVIANTEYVPVRESIQRVAGRVLEAKGSDDSGGKVFAFQIIDAGTSRNGVDYPLHVLAEAAPLYEGAKSFDHHRTMEELQTSSTGGLVGHWRNVAPNAQGIQGDLHLLPSATHVAEALVASLDAQAQGLPPIIGVSHDVQADLAPARIVGGRTVRECTAIKQVLSTDVVADPSAGGRATRLVAGGPGDATPEEEYPMNLKQLLALLRAAADDDARQKLLTEHAAVIEASGYTAEEVLALRDVEGSADDKVTEPPTPPAAETEDEAAGELVHAAESITGRMLVREAVSLAGLDEALVDDVVSDLGARFTEAQVSAAVARVKRVAESMERRGLTPRVPGVRVTEEAIDKKREKFYRTLEGGAGGGERYRSLRQAFVDISGYTEHDLIDADLPAVILRESRLSAISQPGIIGRQLESLTTSSWGEILGDSITRRLIAAYNESGLDSWRQIVSDIVPVNDFRTQRRDRLGGYGDLSVVTQGAPYQAVTSPGDEEASDSLDKYGGTEDLTMETIANDDLGAVRRIPNALAIAAAFTLHKGVWGILSDNVTCSYDSVALFHSGHANTDTSAALAQSTLDAARAAMRTQSSYGTSRPLSTIPKFLVLPNELEQTGLKLTGGRAVPSSGESSDMPNIHEGLKPIVVDYWTDANDWFLVADPRMIPTIEVGFYQGREEPELFVQDDPRVGSVFTSDKITYKIRHIWYAMPLEHRAFIRRQG